MQNFQLIIKNNKQIHFRFKPSKNKLISDSNTKCKIRNQQQTHTNPVDTMIAFLVSGVESTVAASCWPTLLIIIIIIIIIITYLRRTQGRHRRTQAENPGEPLRSGFCSFAAVLLLREEASAAVLRENPGEPLRSGFVVFVGLNAVGTANPGEPRRTPPTGLNAVGTALGTSTGHDVRFVGHGGGLVRLGGGLVGRLRGRRTTTNEREEGEREGK